MLRIINEPTAASLAYGLDRRQSGTIAVYDFGGGTFDISILRVEDGVFQVLATNGDTHLGGDDIDQLLVALVLGESDLGRPADPARFQAVRRAVIQAKWDLSERDETVIRVADPAAPGADEPLFERRLSRDEFERLVRPVVERTLEPCRLALADAGLDVSQIDEAVLVGGSTRIPLVRRSVQELFGRKPHAELNPDEVVAIGAAIQAHIMVSGSRDMLLLDVTPLSLGIETMGGAMSKIILRNSTIPASGTEMFTTFVDNQTAVDIHVLQGERELVGDNRSLARFKLRGIPPMPAGLPRIQVRFQIDANGILSVGAHELRTGIEQTIEVKPSYGLTDEEVERMLLESFEHAEADVEARVLIEARNEAETVIRATEKSLRNPDLEAATNDLAPGELAAIESALADLRSVMASARPRRARGEDQGAQRRDAASGRGDDEPRRPRGAGGEERGRSVTLNGQSASGSVGSIRLTRDRLPTSHWPLIDCREPLTASLCQGRLHPGRRAEGLRHRPGVDALPAPRPAGVAARRGDERRRADRARLRRALRVHHLPRDRHRRRREPERARGRGSGSARHGLGGHSAVAPRVPGGREGRRGVRDPRLLAQLRAGRRRHPAGEGVTSCPLRVLSPLARRSPRAKAAEP